MEIKSQEIFTFLDDNGEVAQVYVTLYYLTLACSNVLQVVTDGCTLAEFDDLKGDEPEDLFRRICWTLGEIKTLEMAERALAERRWELEPRESFALYDALLQIEDVKSVALLEGMKYDGKTCRLEKVSAESGFRTVAALVLWLENRQMRLVNIYNNPERYEGVRAIIWSMAYPLSAKEMQAALDSLPGDQVSEDGVLKNIKAADIETQIINPILASVGGEKIKI